MQEVRDSEGLLHRHLGVTIPTALKDRAGLGRLAQKMLVPSAWHSC